MRVAIVASVLSFASVAGACPEGSIVVPPTRTCVDVWEANVETWSDDDGWVPHSPYEEVDPLAGFLRAVSGPDRVPQAHISGSAAQSACLGSGRRLCSRKEFLIACKGPARWQYPYGPQRKKGVCNEGLQVSAVLTLFPDEHGKVWDNVHMNDPRLNQRPGFLAKTGEFSGCVSGYGIHDLVGNLHEWIDDDAGTFVGGYYGDAEQLGHGCEYGTFGHSFGYHDYSTGFRCCSDEEAAPGP